ncbi:MAG: hypothetical protein IPK76_12385 [Lewinellaceae bacterium]|jgi:hypothetical protein|nr:hypothetical protein [Lewinellaceae bacterium]
MSFLIAPFSKIVSKMEDDAGPESPKESRFGAKFALGILLTFVLVISMGLGLFIRLWQRLEIFFEVVQ